MTSIAFVGSELDLSLWEVNEMEKARFEVCDVWFTPQSTFCPEKKSADKFGFGSQYVLMNELGEVASTVLGDPKVTAVLNKFSGMVDFLHFSDQYSGPKQPE